MYKCRIRSKQTLRLPRQPEIIFRMASTLRQRSVVSSFICKPTSLPAGFEVAIFKRSKDVSTYQGKWAACSGSIESTDSSPEEAAKREMQEETTLTDADITLYSRGKPFTLVDEGLKTEWTIHPFAWMMKEGSRGITFDWEHTEYKFIKPEDLNDYDTVPNLEFGMKRCFVGPETAESLNALRDDHESGAQGLAILALNMLLKASEGARFSKETGSDPEAFWKVFRMTAWHLAKNGRPSMGPAIEASLFRALDTIRHNLEQAVPPNIMSASKFDLASFRLIAEAAIWKKITARKASLSLLSGKFVDFFKQDGNKMDESLWPSKTTIVTLSSSGTIKQCLLDLVWSFISEERSVKLCILESRPKFEGATFAKGLLDSLDALRSQGRYQGFNPILKNFKIEIVSDASVATVVHDADYLLLGADKVLSDGSTSNKIGSLTASVMAKTLHPACKVVAVFETDKITGNSDGVDHLKVEYNDEAEVIGAWPAAVAAGLVEKRKKGYHVTAKNAYFEWVSPKYIDTYITERGILSIEDISKLSVESEELEKRLFADV